MNPLHPAEQFLSESRELLQGIGEKLMQLEDAPNDQGMHRRTVSPGAYTQGQQRPVHISGDDARASCRRRPAGQVRSGEIVYSRELADRLLDAMDFVRLLCGMKSKRRNTSMPVALPDSARMAEALRALMRDRDFARCRSQFLRVNTCRHQTQPQTSVEPVCRRSCRDS